MKVVAREIEYIVATDGTFSNGSVVSLETGCNPFGIDGPALLLQAARSFVELPTPIEPWWLLLVVNFNDLLTRSAGFNVALGTLGIRWI